MNRFAASPSLLVGLDGCRGGWAAVWQLVEGGAVSWGVFASFAAALEALPKALFAVDIPIGLPESGARDCDWLARRALGRGKGGSVFPAPPRALLAARTYAEACGMRQTLEGKKISLQTWNILPKIREVDAALQAQPGLRGRIFESFPELSFVYLNAGLPLPYRKRSREGRQLRLSLLGTAFGEAPLAALNEIRGSGCAPDDLLDAFALLWSAGCNFRGQANRLPSQSVFDETGLEMKITV